MQILFVQDKFWMHQDVKYYFTADLTGIDDIFRKRNKWIVVLVTKIFIHQSVVGN